jgi:hypothetical protein
MTKSFGLDRFEQILFAAGFHAGSHKVTHTLMVTRNT